MSTNVLGKVTWNPRGEYDEETTYEKFDVVYYNQNAYVAKEETTGNLPTDEHYWELLVRGGTNVKVETTPPSDNATYVGEMWLNTNEKKLYIATSIDSISPIDDWTILN